MAATPKKKAKAVKKRTTRRRRSTQTWSQWLESQNLHQLVELPDDVSGQTWKPTEEDRNAAWELYTEMRTRISTQPLHYRAGDEETALNSVYSLFQATRDLTRKHGTECRHFATISVYVLNVVIRPFTARWHGRKLKGELNAEDGRHYFRMELRKLQNSLQQFQRFLGLLAEGDDFKEGSETGLEAGDRNTELIGRPIPYDQLLPHKPSQASASDTVPADVRKEMIAAETRDIRARRAHVSGVESDEAGTEPVEDLVGLAISGGGIRSATFALGVLQGLTRKPLPNAYRERGQESADLLRDVDVMSTVSGGSYLGSFLSSFLNDSASNEHIGPRADQLPFRREGKCEAAPIRSLRNHSRYLISGGLLGRLTMIGQGLFGVVMNLVILVAVICLFVCITDCLTAGDGIRDAGELLQGNRGPAWIMADWAICALCIQGIVVLGLPIVQKLGRDPSRRHFRKRYEFWCALGFGVTLLIVAYTLIPTAHYGFLWGMQGFQLYDATKPDITLQTVWAGVANLVAFLLARGAMLKSAAAKQTKGIKSLIRVGISWLLMLAGPLLLLMLYFLLCEVLITNRVPGVPDWLKEPLWPTVAVLIYGFVALNVNFISPHRYYRNRLVETYLLKYDHQAQDGSVKSQDGQLLSALGTSPQAPYHLINGALNLPDSNNPELRGRNSDFFLFSRHFSGSPVMGYFPTKDWERFDGHFDLGTAMAISGAAASPHMGSTTPGGASFFLTLLNIRLGYWLRRPDVTGLLPHTLERLLGGPDARYLFREMFGRIRLNRAFSQSRPLPYVNVSDGGHIENLGVYELLRRRCRFVVAIDGECDPKLEFPSLMRLIQYAWIDLGIRIALDVDELRLNDKGLSHSHFALGKIYYPETASSPADAPEGQNETSRNDSATQDGCVGLLLYIKLSVTGNEPAYVQDYGHRESDFPHQSTADQIFDEAQFEAYRALGEHVAREMLRGELLNTRDARQLWENRGPDGRLLTMHEYFKTLYNNLFEHD
mgnify:CR=1 FL=1